MTLPLPRHAENPAAGSSPSPAPFPGAPLGPAEACHGPPRPAGPARPRAAPAALPRPFPGRFPPGAAPRAPLGPAGTAGGALRQRAASPGLPAAWPRWARPRPAAGRARGCCERSAAAPGRGGGPSSWEPVSSDGFRTADSPPEPSSSASAAP